MTIALNVLYAKKEKNTSAYVSKTNSNHEKQVILLMIPNGEGRWHYLSVKKLSALLRGVTPKHHSDFNCLNCLHSFATENKLELHTRVFENIDFCNVIVKSKDIKILVSLKSLIKHHLLFMHILNV